MTAGRNRFGRAALVLAALSACVPKTTSQRHLVFVSEAASADVAVIDPVAMKVIRRLPVGMLPHNLLLSPDSSRLYVVLVGSQAIAEIDTAALSVVRTFLTAPLPERREDGTLIQQHRDPRAAAATSCSACHFDGGNKPMYVGERPIGVDFSADGSRLFVSHLRSGNLSVIDRERGQLVRTLHLAPTAEAREAAELVRQGSELIVALRPPQPATTSGVLRRLDAETLTARGEAPTGSDPGSVAASPAGDGRVLVANFEANTVSEFGPSGLEATYTVSPGPLGLRRLADGRVLVLNYYSNSISLLDPQSKRVETMGLTLEGRTYSNPTRATLSPDGRIAYIVSSGPDAHLLAFDVAAKRVVSAMPIHSLSFDVAVAPAPETAASVTQLSAAFFGKERSQ